MNRASPPRRKTAKRTAPTKPRVVLVGFGRLGGSLAVALRQAGWPVSVVSTTKKGAQQVVRHNFKLADAEALRRATLCILAVPEAAISQAADMLRSSLGPRTALIHCAGALPFSILQGDTRPVGSFHPLCAVSSRHDTLAGHAVAVAATHAALRRLLRRMALAVNLWPLEVPEPSRSLYHAGAVLSAGLAMTLLSTGVEALTLAGIPPAKAQNALVALMKSALKGIEVRGLPEGLTGPICRGDTGVVKAHLLALPPSLARIYRTLSLRMLDMVQSQLPPEKVEALARLLKQE